MRSSWSSWSSWDAGPAPRLEPLAYPGRWPPRSVLLTDEGVAPLRLPPGTAAALPLFEDRTPVLAVGSNASPAQLRHKFVPAGVSVVVPMMAVEVSGLAAGVAAFVARAGYVPATPVLRPGHTAQLFVLWLEPDQLTRLDATEPNYRRTPLTSDGGVRIALPSGHVLDRCDVYAGLHGHLDLGDGAGPLLLGHQTTLLGRLLAASPRLREVLGDSPASWVERAPAPDVRATARAAFRTEGWVREDPFRP